MVLPVAAGLLLPLARRAPTRTSAGPGGEVADAGRLLMGVARHSATCATATAIAKSTLVVVRLARAIF